MVKIRVATLSEIEKQLTINDIKDQLKGAFILQEDSPNELPSFASMVGYYLSVQLLRESQHFSESLSGLYRDVYGKWKISPACDFNISHSGDKVIVAITHQGLIGVDIEKVRPIAWSDYRDSFTPNEWADLSNSANPEEMFFSLWTKKESLAKAYGFGLQLPLDTLLVSENIGNVANTTMVGYFHTLALPGYSATICMSIDGQEILVENFILP
jgi:phosphopantetheinyl transferase